MAGELCDGGRRVCDVTPPHEPGVGMAVRYNGAKEGTVVCRRCIATFVATSLACGLDFALSDGFLPYVDFQGRVLGMFDMIELCADILQE